MIWRQGNKPWDLSKAHKLKIVVRNGQYFLFAGKYIEWLKGVFYQVPGEPVMERMLAQAGKGLTKRYKDTIW